MKIVVIEDEKPAADRLIKLIQMMEPDTDVLAVIDSVEDAVSFFEKKQEIDLIFMDIHLADGNSFEIFKLCDISKPVIFTTAYDSYALDAFKVYSLDYLLKPIKQDELAAVFKKYHAHFEHQTVAFDKLEPEALKEKKFLIRTGTKIVIINYEDVAYYFTRDKITFLVSFSGQKYPVDYPLEFIEHKIAGSDYFRINRQFIVHRKAIQTMNTASKSRVKLKLVHPAADDVIVSVERSPEFKKWIRK